MSDPIGALFDGLARRAPERLLPKTRGTIRFELEGDDGVDVWHLTIADARVSVSREAREADTVIRTDLAFFARMARGEAKPLPAWLRNDITTEGQFRFIVLLERLFAAPPGARHPRLSAGGRRESG
ncbi:SCP-2 sterol transfer family protein [Micromonospora rhizosphaerae]|uniref:SCP-2 sterol transfer family protein n=1 Tax=Micromonospora rhizosphaerae TaxID=568872 RepID=A0A1C6SHS3_9ACTN|nr:SCP2 sterol-binding domain-containing protein [Micromonospora rhizosphaerae]SCL29007.1 SCP-2 sterol transfer family protein [Micromonospora rhizosphaerae]